MCGRFTTISHEDVVRVVRAMQAELRQQTGEELGIADECLAFSARSNEPTEQSKRTSAMSADTFADSFLMPRDVRPNDVVPLIRLQPEGFCIGPFTWGFPGFDKSGPLFNTRFERAFGNPGMWAQPFQEGRCIVCARAFFEPHATETVRSPRTGRPIKAQYRFETGKIMLMAGVSGGDGRFSVVTTEPNAQVSPIHDRMPLLLDLPSALAWLQPGSAWLDVAASTLPLVAEAEIPTQPASPQLSLF